MGGREVGGERRYCRHRRRRREGRPRATPPCAQRSVSPAEAARPQQPRKSVRVCSLSPCSGATEAGFPGFVWPSRREQPAGREGGRAWGNPGQLRPGARGPLAQCGGRGAGRGCAPGAEGGARLSRFLSSPTPLPCGAGGPTPLVLGFSVLGVRDRAVRSAHGR